ncbi:hypothetical protein [Bifidobacterium xylocopae]|uniref:hypothetical protein n=1 Tax=Bifidobacterium xylocopae TaxID=2493119 RepID=UPI000FDEDAD5|nr:hypothetical protein [Bifidobacterium xylocopae]
MSIWHKWMKNVTSRFHKGVSPSYAFAKMSEVAPSNAVWFVDVGTFTSFRACFLTARSTQVYIVSAWLGTMCCALPGVIASKRDMSDRPLCVVCGGIGVSVITDEEFDAPSRSIRAPLGRSSSTVFPSTRPGAPWNSAWVT